MKQKKMKQPYNTLIPLENQKQPTTIKKRVHYADEQQQNVDRISKTNPANLQSNRSQPKGHPLEKQDVQDLLYKIQQLKKLKHWYMMNNRYKKAIIVDEKIQDALTKVKKERVRRVSLDHIRQKQQVKQAHRREMKNFYRVWSGVFEYQQECKRVALQKFQRSKKEDEEILQKRLRDKYYSLRSRSKSVIQIEHKQKTLKKMGKVQQLILLRKDIRKAEKQIQQQKQEEFKKFVKQQEQKFKIVETKRYNSLMMRLQEVNKSTKKKFHREQARLKQKYKNVLCQLSHEQTKQMNLILWKNLI